MTPAAHPAVKSRFAPSPTGRLHLGHAWSALHAHDFARARGGGFVLRIEDLDPTRSRPEHVDAIVEDLTWLGLTWDGEVMRQSGRGAAYTAALDRLRAMGATYPCFCTRADIAAATQAPHGPAGPLYPGTCRAAADWSRASGEPHAVRLDVARALALLAAPVVPANAGTPTGEGSGAGPHRGSRSRGNDGKVARLSVYIDGSEVEADPTTTGDVVLARKDAPAAYHLAVVVDDAAQGITDVVRGTDLADAVHVQRLLQALLGLPTPDYHHHPLVLGPDGQRLAKRHNAPTLAEMRIAGVDGRALADSLRAARFPPGFRLAAS